MIVISPCYNNGYSLKNAQARYTLNQITYFILGAFFFFDVIHFIRPLNSEAHENLID